MKQCVQLSGRYFFALADIISENEANLKFIPVTVLINAFAERF